MSYNISDRHVQNNKSTKKQRKGKSDPNRVDLGKVGTVFIICGLLSLITSWVFSMETEEIVNTSFYPSSTGGATEVGPISVRKHSEVYNISVKSNIPVQSWSFVEGQVLNDKKEFLYSFGKEFWHESGRDSEGSWREAENDYSINVTFPTPGAYYLHFQNESNSGPSNVELKIVKKRGSSIPHLVFGLITLILGIVLNEMRNKTLVKTLGKFES